MSSDTLVTSFPALLTLPYSSALRYYEGSDSCHLHLVAGLPAYLAQTSRHSVSKHVGDPNIALTASSAYLVCFRLRLESASSPSLPAETSSLYYGLPVRFRLLSTPPRDDAVTFRYGVLAYSDTDLHRAVCAPSQAHIGVEKGSRPPLPPNRTCGSLAFGSPDCGFLIGIGSLPFGHLSW